MPLQPEVRIDRPLILHKYTRHATALALAHGQAGHHLEVLGAEQLAYKCGDVFTFANITYY